MCGLCVEDIDDCEDESCIISVHHEHSLGFAGKNWKMVTSKVEWSPRAKMGATAYKGTLWVMGGEGVEGAFLSDVWKWQRIAEGENNQGWIMLTSSAAWGKRRALSLVFLPKNTATEGEGLNRSMLIVVGGAAPYIPPQTTPSSPVSTPLPTPASTPETIPDPPPAPSSGSTPGITPSTTPSSPPVPPSGGEDAEIDGNQTNASTHGGLRDHGDRSGDISSEEWFRSFAAKLADSSLSVAARLLQNTTNVMTNPALKPSEEILRCIWASEDGISWVKIANATGGAALKAYTVIGHTVP